MSSRWFDIDDTLVVVRVRISMTSGWEMFQLSSLPVLLMSSGLSLYQAHRRYTLPGDISTEAVIKWSPSEASRLSTAVR